MEHTAIKNLVVTQNLMETSIGQIHRAYMKCDHWGLTGWPTYNDQVSLQLHIVFYNISNFEEKTPNLRNSGRLYGGEIGASLNECSYSVR